MCGMPERSRTTVTRAERPSMASEPATCGSGGAGISSGSLGRGWRHAMSNASPSASACDLYNVRNLPHLPHLPYLPDVVTVEYRARALQIEGSVPPRDHHRRDGVADEVCDGA